MAVGRGVTISAVGTLSVDATTNGVRLNGANGTPHTFTSTGDNTVTLGAVTAVNNGNLVVNSENTLTLESIDVNDGSVTLNVDTDGDTAAVNLTVGALSAGSINYDGGADLDDVLVVNGDQTATTGSISFSDFATADLNGDVSATTTLSATNVTTVDLGDNVDLSAGGNLDLSTVTTILLSGADTTLSLIHI
mgnify:CR=1 FL=1